MTHTHRDHNAESCSEICEQIERAMATVRRVHPEVASPTTVAYLKQIAEHLSEMATDAYESLAVISQRLEALERAMDGRRDTRRTDPDRT